MRTLTRMLTIPAIPAIAITTLASTAHAQVNCSYPAGTPIASGAGRSASARRSTASAPARLPTANAWSASASSTTAKAVQGND